MRKALISDLQVRRKRYFRLSSQIAQMDNAKVCALLDHRESGDQWGRNQTIDLGRSKVFVKRVPMTDLERDNMFSTRNMYALPTYYNYGIGSAGLGVFRELVTHIKTTNWVLDGQIANFPLMYHYRIVPFSGTCADRNMDALNEHIEYWGGSENIRNYVLDRANARHELVLFLEHIPHDLLSWLPENFGRLHQTLDDLRTASAFLRKHGIIHFDAHLQNVVTDGKRAYLTDFGLTLDRSFALTPEEHAFLHRHVDYDAGELLWCVGRLIMLAYEALSESDRIATMEKYGIPEGMRHDAATPLLLSNIEAIHADGIMRLDKVYVAAVVKYRAVILLMHDFYAALWKNNRKDTRFPATKLRRLLKQTGW